MMSDWQEDLTELKSILPSLKRPQNIKLIQDRIKSTQLKIDKSKAQIPTKVQQPKQSPVVPSAPSSLPPLDNFITIHKYSYDQQGKKVKIYLTLENIGNECKQDQIKITFTEESVAVRIIGYKGQNYCFVVRRLCGKIDPALSKFTVKTNTVILTMLKTEIKHWDSLQWKETKVGAPEMGKDKNPEAGLMDLMKKMYEEGDENMKRTIAESWTKARDKNPGMGI